MASFTEGLRLITTPDNSSELFRTAIHSDAASHLLIPDQGQVVFRIAGLMEPSAGADKGQYIQYLVDCKKRGVLPFGEASYRYELLRSRIIHKETDQLIPSDIVHAKPKSDHWELRDLVDDFSDCVIAKGAKPFQQRVSWNHEHRDEVHALSDFASRYLDMWIEAGYQPVFAWWGFKRDELSGQQVNFIAKNESAYFKVTGWGGQMDDYFPKWIQKTRDQLVQKNIPADISK